MEKTKGPSRPTQTDDLVRRLGSSDTDSKQRKALQALSKEMIKAFRDDTRLSYVREAAALAPVTTDESYRDLSRAFNKAIISGTADGNTLELRLLTEFTYVLRCAEGTKKPEMELGLVMKSLRTRLVSAVEVADPNSQYQLISTLSSVLDAMIDIKTAGLSRELHDPLLKQLDKLSKNRELRLAQAAGYAFQALLGISNDETPYQALWRLTRPLVEGVLMVAGSIPTMDPSKLYDGLVGSLEGLQDVPDLISSMVEVVNRLSSIIGGRKSGSEGIMRRQKQKSWYVALRFTDMLIQAKAFRDLGDYVHKLPCCQEVEFLCGTFAQLEQAWEGGTPSNKAEIEKFLHDVLVPIGLRSTISRVQEWVKLVAATLDRSDWNYTVQPARRSRRSFSWKNENLISTVPCKKMRDDARPTDLLELAWLRCTQAQVFYADIKIIEHYYQDERRLVVERLSGEPLSMDQCYINLAILERSNGLIEAVDSGDQSSPFSLLARLKVETPQKDKQVDLFSLFNPRKRQDGTIAPPERILIRGQAGVGKTTLCKRIAYDFLLNNMWAGSFSRLLWVPLRGLKGRSTPGYSIKQWLGDEYFHNQPDRDIFAEVLTQTMIDPITNGRTLFILDGLDEVSRDLDSETQGLIHYLLKQSHVIITSRPSGMSLSHIGRVDLELETVGFYPGQVNEYIKKTVPDKAEKIQDFLRERSLLQGLVRIPIQLEALCYSWYAVTENLSGAPTTMTTLYQAIEQKLLKKDAARLGKLYDGMPLVENTARQIHDTEIRRLMLNEVSLLQGLAFTGFYNDVIEFDTRYQTEMWKHWDKILKHLEPREIPPSAALAKLSFLRTPNTSSDAKNRSYHFLHLTYEEFFAAQYFVEHWKSNKPLQCLELRIGKFKDAISAEEFLQKEKYNARYDIFWRFVAGLLQADSEEGQVCRFFAAIESEPRDLLGPTHQRLIMHCLSEMVLSKESPGFAVLRAALEEQLSQWLLFECNFRETSQFAGEMEFPEIILDNVLQRESEGIKIKVLSSLSRRPKIPPKIIDLVSVWLRDCDFSNLRIVVFNIFSYSPDNDTLPEGILQAMAVRLKDQDKGVRRVAAFALSGQSALPEGILQAVAVRLEDQDGDVRRAAVSALGGQSALPEGILQAVVARLEDHDGVVREAAASALSRQSALPEGILQAVAARLEDQDRKVRQAAVSTLSDQSALSEGILQAVAARLGDQDRDVRGFATTILGRQSALPEGILQAVVARLEDQDGDVRWAAASTLGRQSALPKGILEAVTARLEDQDGDVRGTAASALRGQVALPEGILQAVAARLEDQDGVVRGAVASTLGRQSAPPEGILQAVAARLEDQDRKVRWAVASALRGQSALPEGILQALAARLEDQDGDVRQAVINALGHRSALPKGILEAVAARLEDQSRNVRWATASALGGQLALPDGILQAVAARLEDQDGHVRRAVINALGHQPALPKGILEAVAARLEDQDEDVRRAAAVILGRQSILSKEVIFRYAKPLYRIWLARSFTEHLSWSVADEICYVNTPESFKLLQFDGLQDGFEDAIRKVQHDLGVPLSMTPMEI